MLFSKTDKVIIAVVFLGLVAGLSYLVAWFVSAASEGGL